MNRLNFIIAAIAAVVLVVLFWLFLWQPRSDEIAEIEAQTDQAETQVATLRARIAALEDVRARAPEIEAALVAAESVVPRDAAMAVMVRQIALAAEDSGVTVVGVQPARPERVSEELAELAAISLSVQVEGGYFQVVDFLRRLEDPAITARGFNWNSMIVTGDAETYPTLTVSMGGSVFAIMPAPPVVEEPADPAPADGASPSPSPSPTGGES